MKRIVMHWTAGGHRANGTDKRHYHFVVEIFNGRPRVVAGNHAPEVNERIVNPSDGNTYAAHTRGLNTGAIGVAIAGMRGARERPFDAGPSPMRQDQIDLMCEFVADLAKQYRIPISPETVLTHAEVQPRLGVSQRNKWDIAWLPGMDRTGDPLEIGDKLRAQIRRVQQGRVSPVPQRRPAAERATPGLLAAIGAGILALLAFFGMR